MERRGKTRDQRVTIGKGPDYYKSPSNDKPKSSWIGGGNENDSPGHSWFKLDAVKLLKNDMERMPCAGTEA